MQSNKHQLPQSTTVDTPQLSQNLVWENLSNKIKDLISGEINGSDLIDHIQDFFVPKSEHKTRPILVIGSDIDRSMIHAALLNKDKGNLLVIEPSKINEDLLLDKLKDEFKKNKNFDVPSRLIHTVKEAKYTFDQIQENKITKLKKDQKKFINKHNKFSKKTKK